MSMSEIAEMHQLSERTVNRDWTFAKTRLHEMLQDA